MIKPSTDNHQLTTFLRNELSESSVKTYVYEIEKFKKHYRDPEKISYQNLMEYVELLRKNYNPQSVKRTIYAIKKYYDYLVNIGKLKQNIATNIKIKDGKENPIQLQELLTEKELQKLLEPRKERYPMLAKRNQIVISLLVNQALLVGDIEKLSIEDLDLKEAKIRIQKTGITNSRILELKAEQILLFYQYLKEEREQLKTFRTESENYFLLGKLGTKITSDDINYLVSTYKKNFTKKLTSITIRQSVIKLKLDNGENLRKVQYFVGHKHADTTEKYRETGIDALQTAINQFHPIK
ncbi:tyrosine-type recombinase/integrase [Chryseobacterium balustinum]|uniref:Site-specific recombinase XerD n=1 Tax=Chryseobacterium balustinum TaxID=246 RepID=A0AAQ1S6R2_9FLAO|nr:tyrosine-type recombinase/integrase [Chryseobacterium balustinum]AZB28700.1 integrase [Chryseobacterium balustinum]AZB28707.1 integrase [Chryseobacterium balustinum]SKC07104.1 Site-specific recombinase XerD [Chryseobacterium balustinum]SKC07188.1 Site-specific recombinase XerD [Chryseobacterium balustinum]SQA91835.1 Tyrosine recombinase XerC [Chryseobacterium balustinum]